MSVPGQSHKYISACVPQRETQQFAAVVSSKLCKIEQSGAKTKLQISLKCKRVFVAGKSFEA